MTTSVIVQVAGHKVAVTERRVTEGEVGHNVDDVVTTMNVQGETRTFYAHSGQKLLIEELGEDAEQEHDEKFRQLDDGELTDD